MEGELTAEQTVLGMLHDGGTETLARVRAGGDFDEEIAGRLTGLFRSCGYTVLGIRARGDGMAEVEYDVGASRTVNISGDGALAAYYDIIAAVGHFG